MTTPEAMVADLQQQLASLGDSRDCRSDNERDTYSHTYNALQRRITTIMNAVPDIEKLDPEIAAVETWITHEKTWRKEFCEVMDTLPARAADRTQEQEQRMIALTMAIKNIDFGCEYVNGYAMLAGPLREKIQASYTPTWDMQTLDPWTVGYGCLKHAEQRLADLVKKREALQAQLDEALREPEPVTVPSEPDPVTTS